MFTRRNFLIALTAVPILLSVSGLPAQSAEEMMQPQLMEIDGTTIYTFGDLIVSVNKENNLIKVTKSSKIIFDRNVDKNGNIVNKCYVKHNIEGNKARCIIDDIELSYYTDKREFIVYEVKGERKTDLMRQY